MDSVEKDLILQIGNDHHPLGDWLVLDEEGTEGSMTKSAVK